MITILQFSSKIYFIKSSGEISIDELKNVPEFIRLIDERKFELKPHDHGLLMLHLLDR